MTLAPRDREPPSAYLPVLRLLANLGWHYLPTGEALALRGGTREVILKPRLIEVLRTRRFDYKGERFPLSPSGIDQIVRQVQALSLAEGLLPANERLYRMLTLGVTVTEFMPDGKRHQPTIALVDWQNVAANRWDVTPALAVLSTHGTHLREAGLVACVNGLPLAVVEAGPADDPVAGGPDAIDRHTRHQRPDEIPQLYAYAQLLFALDADDPRYGTTLTPRAFWARWREEGFGTAQVQRWKNRPGPAALHGAQAPDPATAPVTDTDRLLSALLQPERLLEFVRLFVLFDRRAGKLVARYPQFFAVRALLARLQQRRPDGGREGGVVWHTTGSGKSFTMVFLTKALVLHANTQACRVLVVTDRIDLEAQLARNFVNSGAFGSAVATRRDGEKVRVGTGRELARRIGQGTERTIFTLVHKFATASRQPDCYNPSADLIVLVDEGHRSHGGDLHERMRKALPRAACVAFTGTPLLRHEKTAERFGPIVHAHTLRRAVEDGTVAPLLYEQRVPEGVIDDGAIEHWLARITAGMAPPEAAAFRQRFAHHRASQAPLGRLQLIAWDIAQHFSEHVRKPGLGLKGQLATASKREAVRYKQCLDATGLVSSAIVMSAPERPEGRTDRDEGPAPEVQRWWHQHVGRNAEAYEHQVLQGFGGDGGPDLLIVVDRLLTGFDEPRNAVLYIDKPLQQHGLIQAVARVNRLHAAKHHGVLVDYRGVLQALDTAVRAYQDLERRTQGGYDIEDIDGLYRQVATEYERLPALHRALWDLFSPLDGRDGAGPFRRRLAERDLQDRFHAALTAFGLCLQTALSSRGFFEDERFGEALVATYRRDWRFFLELHATSATPPDATGPAVREPEARYGQGPDTPGPSERACLDICRRAAGGSLDEPTLRQQARAIDAVVRQAMAEHSLHPQNVEAAIRQRLLPLLFPLMGLDKAKDVIAQVIEAAASNA